MIIPLEISTNESHKGLISTIVTVRGHPRIFGGVKFYIDTGSTVSFLSEEDAIRCTVPFKIFDFKERTAVAGMPIMLAHISNLTIYFKTDKEETLPITSPIFNIAKNLSHGRVVQGYPSLIGMDFLNANKIKLVYSPSENVAFLEKL